MAQEASDMSFLEIIWHKRPEIIWHKRIETIWHRGLVLCDITGLRS